MKTQLKHRDQDLGLDDVKHVTFLFAQSACSPAQKTSNGSINHFNWVTVSVYLHRPVSLPLPVSLHLPVSLLDSFSVEAVMACC